LSEVWNPYHEVFNDSEETEAEEGYLNVDGNYELTTPGGVAVDFGCSAGDHLSFEWDRLGDAVIPN